MGYDPEDFHDDPPDWRYFPVEEAQPEGGTAMEQHVITISPQLNRWAVAGKGRFKPGVYVTEDLELVEAAELTRFGVDVRPVFPGEEINVGPYEEDVTLTQGSLQQADMKGGNNPRQTPSKEKEVKNDERSWDYSGDPSLDPNYVPHSQRPQTPTEEADIPAQPPETGNETEESEEPSTQASFEADQVAGVPV